MTFQVNEQILFDDNTALLARGPIHHAETLAIYTITAGAVVCMMEDL
jgi:hypothetical protein